MNRVFSVLLLAGLTAVSPAQVFETTVNGDLAHPLGLRDEADYVAIADLDGDGRDDVLSTTGVYLADGQGAFFFSPITPGGQARNNTGVGDLDGDGSPDIVAGGLVFLNDGAGGFTNLPGALPPPPPAFPCPNAIAHRHPVIADLDGDGDRDVFLSRYDPCTFMFAGHVFLNDGTGMFTELAAAGTPPVLQVAHTAVDDADADGDVDVIVFSDAAAVLHLNDGTGRLSASLTLWTGIGAVTGVSGDVDGDGLADHVFHHGGAVVVLRRTTTGFLPPVTTSPASFTIGLVLADLDQDGADEVGRADPNGLTFSAVASSGMLGPELLRRHVRSRVGRARPLAGDLDDDGRDDVVAQFEGRTTTFLGDGQGGLDELPRHDLPAAIPIPGAVADFDGDGDVDMLARQPAPGGTRLGLLENDGYGDFSFATGSSIVTASAVGEVAHVFDALGNGLPDVIVASQDATPALLLINLGGTFTVSPPIAGTTGTACLQDADLDGDGDRDLVVTLLSAFPPPLILDNLGGGSFAPRSVPSPGGGSRGVAVGDVDADGDPDLLVGWVGATPQILLNDGAGSFTPGQSFGLPFSLVTLGDYDRDGTIDATVAGQLWTNDGTGSFSPNAAVNFGNVGLAAWADDIDDDGDVDHVASSGAAFLNRGSLPFDFTPLTSVPAIGSAISRPLTADVDRDGDLDVFFDGYLWVNHAVQLTARGHGRLGTSLKIDFHSRRAGGAAYWLLVSLNAVDVPAAPFGDLFVDPAASALFDSGALPLPGTRTTIVPIPNTPTIAGVDIHWQALHLDAAGLRLGNLHTTTLRP